MKILNFKLITSSIVATILISLLGLPAQTANATLLENQECLPTVLMLRGSGEPPVVDPENNYPRSSETKLFTTNGFEGPVIGKLLNAFATETDPTKTTDKVKFVGIDYPAEPVGFDYQITHDPVEQALRYIDRYHKSYVAGAKNVVEYIKEDQQLRNCITRYMLVGYSQGVLSVRLAINQFSTEMGNGLITSTYVIGDPAQKSNGATTSRQKTSANSSWDTDGLVRAFLPILDESVASGNILSFPLLLGAMSYASDFLTSDYLIYRDDTDNDVTSRSLCHTGDPTCAFSGLALDAAQHVNYFEPLAIDNTIDNSGYADLVFEVEEFDKQIQAFASLNVNGELGDRELKSLPGVVGTPLSYNIANVRIHDTCWWDENSDGSIELAGVPCIEGYETTNVTSDSSNMSVKIINSIGNEYNLSLSTNNYNPTEFKKLMYLDPEKWYQIAPMNEPDKCIDFSYDDRSFLVDSDPTHGNERNPFLGTCANPNPNGWEETLDVATQSFKPVKSNYHSKPENDLSETRQLQWGVDREYYFDWREPSQKVSLSKTPENSIYYTNTISPYLVKIVDDVKYYSFSQKYLGQEGEKCLQRTLTNKFNFEENCDQSNNQLFSVKEVIPDINIADEMGYISLDSDQTMPQPVTDFFISAADRNSVKLTWNSVTDPKNHPLTYNIFQKTDIGTFVLIQSVNEYTNSAIVDLSATEIYKENVFYIQVQELSRNVANSEHIKVFTPSDIYIPEAPSAEYNNAGRIYVTVPDNIEVPYDTEDKEYIFYRNGGLISLQKDELGFYDSDIAVGETYSYSYKIQLNKNNYSSKSYVSSAVFVENIVDPLVKPSLMQVDVSYNMAEIKVASVAEQNVYYQVYRDGEFSQTVFYPETSFVDFGLSPDSTYVYTVIAKSYNGNQSQMSEPLIIETLSDTEPPAQPILSLNYINDTSIGFSIESSDNLSISSYDIYRNGDLIATVPYTSFDDYGLIPETSYYYSVIAKDEAGNESLESLILEVETASSQNNNISVPKNLVNYYIGPNVVALKWEIEEPWNVAYYSIFRNGIEIANNHQKGFFIDRNVEEETQYTYAIKAKSWSGSESEPTNILVVTSEDSDDIYAPSNFNFEYPYYFDGTIYLKWTEAVDSSNVVYSVYRDDILINSTSELTFEDLNVSENEVYTYKIVATDALGNITVIDAPYQVNTTVGGGMG